MKASALLLSLLFTAGALISDAQYVDNKRVKCLGKNWETILLIWLLHKYFNADKVHAFENVLFKF